MCSYSCRDSTWPTIGRNSAAWNRANSQPKPMPQGEYNAPQLSCTVDDDFLYRIDTVSSIGPTLEPSSGALPPSVSDASRTEGSQW